MASDGTLHSAFIDELRDTYDAEKQLTKALPKMAKAASSPELRSAFEKHLNGARKALRRHGRDHRGGQDRHEGRLR
jgi:ferritin-like metal-binding protein YciE